MRYKYLVPITGLFTATLVLANTLDNKIFALGSLALPAGIIVFPLVYLAGDILTEVYGYAASRRVIWTGVAALALMVVSVTVARVLPPASFWAHQESFNAILGKVPRIVLASVVAYLCGEFCNSYILAKMKVKTEGRGMSTRFVLSTLVGEFVDTVIFVMIAFAGTFAAKDMVSITFSAWGVKVAWEVLALPFTVIIVRYLKRAENEDYFDRNTNFNPFAVSSDASR